MLNILNNSKTKIENLIYNIREKENDLWNEYMEMVNTYGAESTFAAEMRHKWVILNNIMKDSGIKTIIEIKVKQNDKEKI